MRLAVGVIAILFVLGMVNRSVQEGVPAPAPATASLNCTEEDALLVPCVRYLQGLASSPSDGCCAGLSVVLRTNYICLCQLIVQGQGSFNITDALALPSACHTNADPKKCKDYPGFPNIGGISPIASQPAVPPNVGVTSPTASQPAPPPGSAVQGAPNVADLSPSVPPHHPALAPSNINGNSTSSSNAPSSPKNAAATIHRSAAWLGLFYSTVVGVFFYLLL